MALSEELPIFRASYDLLEKNIGLTKDLPRMLRYSIGDRLIDTNLQLLTEVYRANLQLEKTQAITELLICHRTLQMLLRVVYREKAVSSGRYAEMLKLLDSIGRQATAWKNRTNKKEQT